MIKEKYGVKIITALTIKNKKDVNKYKNYLGITDIFLTVKVMRNLLALTINY